MNIYFHLNNEEETHVMSFHNIASNPFSVGDIVNLSVDDLFPKDYDKYKK